MGERYCAPCHDLQSDVVFAQLLSQQTHTLPQRTHSHYNCEMLYVQKGTASVTVNSEKYILGAGAAMFVYSAEEHSVTSGLEASVISVGFDQSRFCLPDTELWDLPNLLSRAKNSLCDRRLSYSGSCDKRAFEYCFAECLYEYEQGHGMALFGSNTVLFSCCARIIIEFIRKWVREGFSPAPGVKAESGLDIEGVGRYIAMHSDEPLRVEELAKKCGLSYSYFAKRFIRHYGQSCKSYIEKTRIERVQRLLLSTEHDLSYISQELCFSDCSHLIKVFKKHTGMTPKQYRSSFKGRSMSGK